ncbi:MAG: hypothetical protein LBE13_08775 [Bacteroidales bacterium]|jgi:hypothetical protein|nr:hypothetical protein [Bacteroidales bacterium]
MSSTIPSKDFEFNVVQEIISTLADKNAEKWELDRDWVDNVLLPKKVQWKNAWSVYTNPDTRTPLVVFTKSVIKKEYEPLLEILVCNFETNIHVTDKERREMGILNPFRKRKLVPPPELHPGFVIGTSIIRSITVHFFDKETLLSNRPHGASGVEMQWEILDTPPSGEEDLLHSEFKKRPPFVLQFDEKERGKTAYIRLRWKGNTDGYSPWSKIITAMIP